jgi:subtilase family serine protease
MRNQQAQLNVERLEARDLLAPLTGYTPAQIRHAYGFDQMWLDGRGVTIAIVDAYDDPKIGRDLTRFDRAFGLPDPPSFTKVDQFGGTHFSWNDSWSGEISLDVEWAHAIAPQADILLVEAKSNSNQDLDTAVDYARNQPGVVAVSMSYGAGEVPFEIARDDLFTTPAGHIGGFGLPGGINFVAATGDSGAPGGYPAYSPNVLSVGGTSLFLDGAGNYLDEKNKWQKLLTKNVYAYTLQ